MAEVLGKSLLRVEVVTCGVVLYELLQGIKHPSEEVQVKNALQALSYLEMTRELWVSAGKLSSQLRASGHTLPFSDIMIAAIALNYGCSVLTIDRHFEVVPGLIVVS